MARSDVWRDIWLNVERAKEQVQNLETKVIEFMVRRPYGAVVAQERTTGHHVISARVDEQPPVWWSAIAGDVVHNLRSALDITVRQLVIANNERPTGETGFPIAGMGVGAIVGITLDNLIPGTPRERGLESGT